MANVLDRLLAQLNASSTAATDKALGQVIQQLIQELKALIIEVDGLSGGGGGGSTTNITNVTNQQIVSPLAFLSEGDRDTFYIPVAGESTPTPSSGDDYVVLSDGGLPTPLPVDDGFGNFIYIMYTP